MHLHKRRKITYVNEKKKFLERIIFDHVGIEFLPTLKYLRYNT